MFQIKDPKPWHDELVHWCHGAPGVIHLLADAHRLLGGSTEYLRAAQRCADAVWERGLLTKGYSICHGVSGNTYAFVKMWQVTADKTYLDKAFLFAGWCFDSSEKPPQHSPDRPHSLFEGDAGRLFLWADLADDHSRASFPIIC